MAGYLDVDNAGIGGRKSPTALSKEDVSSTYGHFFQEYTLLAEYSIILKSPIEGVYVLPSPMSKLMWFGLVFIRNGLYRGAVFKFTISIPTTYPDGGCPRVDFQPGVFHPMIDYDTGELQTKTTFKRWRRDVNHIRDLLSYIKAVFFSIETKEGFNQEAKHSYQSDRDEFKRKVTECISECSQSALQSDPTDPHSLEISDWHKDIMRAARTEIFEPEFSEDIEVGMSGLPCGLSWVKSYESFKKEEKS